MSEAKFTKGPWFYDSYMEVDGSVRVMHGNITITYHGSANYEDIANAHLIAAAPEMYDMLHSIENDANQIPPFLWDKIQVVLAKARGEHV